MCTFLACCTEQATLQVPTARVPPAWHAPLPHDGRTGALISWWSTFRDPALSALITVAETEHPSLDSAVSEIDRARATLTSAQAGLIPALSGSAAITGSGADGDRANRLATSGTASGGLDASWEIDLFGKVRHRSAAARVRLDERIAEWHGARVSLAAEVADTYVQWRACRQLEGALVGELKSQRETRRAMEAAETSGFRATGDVALVRAGAASASAALIGQQAQCEVLLKVLVRLTGGDEPRVRQLLRTSGRALPTPAFLRLDAVPADALRQRPDINVLEMEVAATRSEIGAAEADQYPSLGLNGSVTLSGSSLTGTSLPWSFGPALSIPLVDGGIRRAAVRSAVAGYDAAVAAYRSGVLAAVAEIETALVRIDSARRQLGDAESAARNYRAYFTTADANWKAGVASLLDREEARRSAMTAEVQRIEIRRDWLRARIALYKALGGGWDQAATGATPAGSAEKTVTGHRN